MVWMALLVPLWHSYRRTLNGNTIDLNKSLQDIKIHKVVYLKCKNTFTYNLTSKSENCITLICIDIQYEGKFEQCMYISYHLTLTTLSHGKKNNFTKSLTFCINVNVKKLF